MEIRFDPRLTTLAKVQRKKDQQQQGNAFEEALQGEEGMAAAASDGTAMAAEPTPLAGNRTKPRNGDGKGLKVDLLA